MTGLFNAPVSQNVRTEIFSKRAVTVFSQQELAAADESNVCESVRFARQIAALKNMQAYSDAFYVMDMGRVSQLMDEWKVCLPRVFPFYSINCNEDSVLLKLMANYDVGFHCQNRQNLEKALEYVCPQRILYTNPMWTRSTLSQAMSNNVNLLCFESARDLDRILMSHPNAELLLHVCVNTESDEPNVLMGCDVENAMELLQLAADSGANCVGISFNLGSARDQHQLYASAIESAARFFEYGQQHLGLNMHTLNLGGGFSHVPHVFHKTCEYINRSLDYFFPIDYCSKIRIIATPGRFFAGSPFSLVTNIVRKRPVDLSHITNDDFDNGREAFIYETNESYYGPFACRLNAVEPKCRPLFDHYLDDFHSEHVWGSIVGSTLDDMDVVQQICRFRPLNEGDWLIWQNMGAYTLSNKTSLDDEDPPHEVPTIFYFASQNLWNGIEFSNMKSDEEGLVCDSVNGSLPSTPLHSVCSNEDMHGRGSVTSEAHSTDDFIELDEEEENLLTVFEWATNHD